MQHACQKALSLTSQLFLSRTSHAYREPNKYCQAASKNTLTLQHARQKCSHSLHSCFHSQHVIRMQRKRKVLACTQHPAKTHSRYKTRAKCALLALQPSLSMSHVSIDSNTCALSKKQYNLHCSHLYLSIYLSIYPSIYLSLSLGTSYASIDPNTYALFKKSALTCIAAISLSLFLSLSQHVICIYRFKHICSFQKVLSLALSLSLSWNNKCAHGSNHISSFQKKKILSLASPSLLSQHFGKSCSSTFSLHHRHKLHVFQL